MNAPYTIEQHRHRFAVWAAARAASRRIKNFKIELASELIECAGLKAKIGDPEVCSRYRVNFLYFTRCGMIESWPSRRILSFS